MPECWKCGRVQPTAEVRRTKLGHVCLEGGEVGKFSRCLTIFRERRIGERAAARQERRRTA